VTLALPKPYGYPLGTGISLRARQPVNGDIVAGLVLGFGCPPFILPKVASAMSASGRYDCRVTVSRQALANLKCCAERLDIDVIVEGEPQYEPFSDKDFR
jgi:hypothetical protein